MGAKQKIDELEKSLASANKSASKTASLIRETTIFIKTLSEIPTDGIICYTQHGMQIQCDVVNGAKVFLERLQREQS